MSKATGESLEKEVSDLRLEVSRLAELLNAQSENELHDDTRPRTGRVKHLSDDLAHFVKFIENYATNEPSKALGFATALGFVIGLLVSRRRH